MKFSKIKNKMSEAMATVPGIMYSDSNNLGIMGSKNTTPTDEFIVFNNVGRHNYIPDDNFNKKELNIGIKIEYEHVPDSVISGNPEFALLIAKNIAKDHLSEYKDYYTRLVKMEKEAKVKNEI